MFDVSVIVPCRNAGTFVLEAVSTAIAQSEPPREIILADDGSSDGSVEQVRDHYPAIRILRGPFGGASSARNAALRQAHGNFIALLDADDTWDREHLARARELLLHSGDTAYLSHFDLLDEMGNRGPMPRLRGLEEPRTGLSLDDYLDFFWKGLPNSSASYVIRRDAVLAANGFDPTQLRANDLDLWMRVIHRSTWCYDPHPGVCYRMRSAGNLSAHIASRSYFRLRALLRLRSMGVSEQNALQELVRYWAKQSLRTAAFRGGEEDWNRALELARGELHPLQVLAWKSVKTLRDRVRPLLMSRAAQ